MYWKSSKYYIFWVCVCSLTYPTWNAHAPRCHLWHVGLYNIFPHYLISGTIKYIYILYIYIYNLICVHRFSAQRFVETFLFLKRTERDRIKNIQGGPKVGIQYTAYYILYTCFWPTLYMGIHVKLFSSDFNETLIFSTYFRKNKQISHFMKNDPVGAELFHANGRTDRHDEAYSRSSQFYERA